MASEAIKRLRNAVVVHGKRGYTGCVVRVAELSALLDIAEAAQLYLTDHSEETGEALIAALSKLEAPGHE